jgi:hypothetical protein
LPQLSAVGSYNSLTTLGFVELHRVPELTTHRVGTRSGMILDKETPVRQAQRFRHTSKPLSLKWGTNWESTYLCTQQCILPPILEELWSSIQSLFGYIRVADVLCHNVSCTQLLGVRFRAGLRCFPPSSKVALQL